MPSFRPRDVQDKDVVSVWQGSQQQVSLQSIQQLASAEGHVDAMECQSHGLERVTEWETVVTTRVDSESKASSRGRESISLCTTPYEISQPSLDYPT
jgi:hypothetical protein